VAVRASGTSLAEVSGVGAVVAATVIGEVRDVSRFRYTVIIACHRPIDRELADSQAPS